MTDMFKMLKEVWLYRDLWWMLTLRDIRIRYKQAAMGFLWAIFMPIIAISAGILIKKAMSVVAGMDMDEKAIVGITFKVLPWTFFVSSIRFAVLSLVGNSSLITKIYFPRAVLPFSAMSACFFDFMIASSLLPLLIVVFKTPPNAYYFLLPIIFICILLFTAGVGLLLAAANLFYRDVKYVVEIILMFGIFFTPVFYDVNALGNYKNFILINPIASLLYSINQIVTHYSMPETSWFLYAIVASVLMFLFGLYIFFKLEPTFAENV